MNTFFSRTFRIFVLALVMLALPVQSMAMLTARTCCPVQATAEPVKMVVEVEASHALPNASSHSMQHTSDAEVQHHHTMHHASANVYNDNHHAAHSLVQQATTSGDQDTSVHTSHTGSTSVCPTCHGLALMDVAPRFSVPVVISLVRPAQSSLLYLSPTPEGLQRPPSSAAL